MKKQFQHDCDRCIYLGTDQVNDDIFDMYWCADFDHMPTVICRFSDDPPDYSSGIESGRRSYENNEKDWPVGIAYGLALKKGLPVNYIPGNLIHKLTERITELRHPAYKEKNNRIEALKMIRIMQDCQKQHDKEMEEFQKKQKLEYERLFNEE